jgi:hypothetical protein
VKVVTVSEDTKASGLTVTRYTAANTQKDCMFMILNIFRRRAVADRLEHTQKDDEGRCVCRDACSYG